MTQVLRSAVYATLSIILTAAIFAMSVLAVRHFSLSHGIFPPSFFLQSIYLVVTLILMAILSKGHFESFGFTRGSFKLTWRFFLWLIPPIALGILGAIAKHSGHAVNSPFGLSNLQIVLFVWVYSSFCEEVLTRGLLQTFLSRSLGKSRVGLTILLSGLFFGAMHLMAVRQMGPGVVVFAVYLGLVAAYYREKSGSLWPAISLHVLFNIFASAPVWLVR